MEPDGHVIFLVGRTSPSAARHAVRDAHASERASEHTDVLRESVALMVREIMELDVLQLAEAELTERHLSGAPATRKFHREKSVSYRMVLQRLRKRASGCRP